MVASITIHLDGAVENLALPLMEDYTTAPMFGGMQEENSLKYVGLLSVWPLVCHLLRARRGAH
jgi:hypothetical protein